MTLQKLISEKAYEYARKKYNHGSLDWAIAKVGHNDGATSMLPVIEDVAVKFAQWCDNEHCSHTAYDYFITNIYKPTI